MGNSEPIHGNARHRTLYSTQDDVSTADPTALLAQDTLVLLLVPVIALQPLEHKRNPAGGPARSDSKVADSKSSVCFPERMLTWSLGISGWRLNRVKSFNSLAFAKGWLLQCECATWELPPPDDFDRLYPAFPGSLCFLHLTMCMLIEASRR